MAALRAATAPVHAYLFVGPPGVGKRAAARSFAAQLLCPSGGDGTCSSCRRALAEAHPDLVVVEREGAFVTVEQAHAVTRLAARSPTEGGRKVLVLPDLHLVRDAGPALLKTVEEPPAGTVFVLLAEFVAPELVTIASRCVRVDFSPLSPERVAEALVAEGTGPGLAAGAAAAAGGRLDRARLLVSDPAFAARQALWRSVPDRLDGTGAAVAQLVDELVASLDAAVEPLAARQAAEVAEAEGSPTPTGRRSRRTRAPAASAGRTAAKEVDERHKRELRRHRTDELRSGLGALGGHYRDLLVAGADPRPCLDALAALTSSAGALARNPNETLLLQSLLLRLPAAATAAP